jgi:hypothetical protein
MPALFKNLDRVPSWGYDFLWADYVELLCLCSQNGCVSSANIQTYTQEAFDTQADFQSDDEDIGQINSDPEILDDQIAMRWDDIYRRLQSRAQSWASWPFDLDGAVLTNKFDLLNPEHRLYVALLIASSLRLCEKTQSNEVTSAFEEISFHWLQRSLSSHWEVRPFGAHQTLPMAYEGTLRAKLEALSKDIRATLQKQADEYDPKDTGDGGIDLVAWMKMGDQRGNQPVIFGQCACSPKDWESKQLSVTGPSVEAHIAPQHPGAAYCFVPHDLHRSDTAWQRASHVLRTVVIDRARILHLFRETQSWNGIPDWPFVQEPTKLQMALAT